MCGVDEFAGFAIGLSDYYYSYYLDKIMRGARLMDEGGKGGNASSNHADTGVSTTCSLVKVNWEWKKLLGSLVMDPRNHLGG